MCQLRGLLAGQGKFDLFHLCLYYGYWIDYDPFDIGGTTMNGLGELRSCISNPNPKLAQTAATQGVGKESLSNGSMMRITPLAVWARKLDLSSLE